MRDRFDIGHTTLQIGGPADWFFAATRAEDVPLGFNGGAWGDVVVEGVGGWAVPLSPLLMQADLVDYPTPKNLNYWWNFGSLAGIVLVIMIVTGVFLAMHYTPHADFAWPRGWMASKSPDRADLVAMKRHNIDAVRSSMPA